MNLTNASLVKHLNASHVKVVKIRVRVSQTNANHVKGVKTLVRVKKIVLSVVTVTVILVSLQVLKFLWQTVYGNLSKRLQQVNMCRALTVSILY